MRVNRARILLHLIEDLRFLRIITNILILRRKICDNNEVSL